MQLVPRFRPGHDGAMNDIESALERLDPASDDDWTADGLPRTDAVSRLAGRSVTRSEISSAAPDLTREEAASAAAMMAEARRASSQPIIGDEEAPAQPERSSTDGSSAGDDIDVSYVDHEDDVVTMLARDVYNSPDLIDRALAEFSRQNMVLVRRRNAIDAKIAEIGGRTGLLERARSLHERGKGSAERRRRQQIKDYQASQMQAREQRARRVGALLSSGVTARDLTGSVAPSLLDQALSTRRREPVVPPRLRGGS